MIKNQEQRLRIGQRFAEVRKSVVWTDEKGIKRKGMTQVELAARCGVPQCHIARVENGRYSVGFDIMEAIAEALGMIVDIVDPTLAEHR